MGILGDALGGIIGGIGGSLIGGASALGANLMTFKQNKELQQRQFDFQERMSNTAYQRAASDLDAAGFNRLMAVTGSGASTPSGASSSMSTPDIAGAMSSGAMMASNIRAQNAAAKNQNADANLKEQQAITEANRRNQIDSETGLNRLMATYQSIVNSNAPAKLKAEVKELVSRTYLNNMTATANQANAATNRINAITAQKNAETNRMVGKEQAKYTKERSRGYTESWSESSNREQHAMGVGSAGGHSKSYTRNY